MTTISQDSETVAVPKWVTDLSSFRRWVHLNEMPERSPVFYLAGEVWFDKTKEQLFSHVRLKQCFYQVLGPLADQLGIGEFFPDGLLLTNEGADLSGNPDGTFVLNSSIADRKVDLIEGAEDGFTELQGTPDMVLEVVSDSSVVKDFEQLRTLYWKASITEYWIVDVRGERLQFDILRHTSEGYEEVDDSTEWRSSVVFGKEFKLTRNLNAFGYPRFQLEVR